MSDILSLNFEIPSYMDTLFFEKVLKSGLRDAGVILDCVQFTQGPNHGENYCSGIYRADVTYSRSTKSSVTVSLIIKIESSNDKFSVTDFFGKETDMYTFALPKIETLLDNVQIVPKMYYSICDPIKIIVFPDMTKEGYRTADRIKGLDEAHCSIVLSKLAQYHAASMQLVRNHPEALKRFEFGMFQRDEWRNFVDNYLTDTIEHLSEVAKAWPGYERISDKLLALKDHLLETVQEANSFQEGDLPVLTHNDLWTNNILFKYDDEKLVDGLLIDFQASFYCSLGIDITHFLYTSPYYDLLENKREHLIDEYYYKPFKATLEKLGYSPIPTLKQVYNEIENREMSGFLWACDKLYLICLNKDDCEEHKPSIEILSDPVMGRKIRAKGMASERYQQIIKYVLRRLDVLGKI